MGLSGNRSFSMTFRREPPCGRWAKILRLCVWTDAECPSPLWGCTALCSVTDLPICPSRPRYFFPLAADELSGVGGVLLEEQAAQCPSRKFLRDLCASVISSETGLHCDGCKSTPVHFQHSPCVPVSTGLSAVHRPLFSWLTYLCISSLV